MVSVGAETWRTKTIPETLTPEWKEDNSRNFMVYNPDQWVVIDVYDEDEGKTDDQIGGVVGLPINRLILRCMDKENKTGTVDVPLTRNNQPVQGETGDVSTVTIKAEWLTVDDSEQSSGESLVAVTLKDIEQIPNQYTGPFRIRVTPSGEDDQPEVKLSRESFSMETGVSPKELLKQICNMQKDGRVCQNPSFKKHHLFYRLRTSLRTP